MKHLFSLYVLFFSGIFSAQTDYSDSCEDFYSYTNVKQMVIIEEVSLDLANNAVIIYHKN